MKSNIPIVGIGASAGGLEAFVQLLNHLDDHTGMAFVLVQHLDPTHESFLSDILGRATRMPVCEVQDGVVPERNHVYVMPPNTRITYDSGLLKLTPRGAATGAAHFPIDDFFKSLAEGLKENAIGIVLSGSGADGANGIAAIVAEGGLTFAQEKSSAKFDSMPAAAIAKGVDFIMTPAGIGAELANVARSSLKPHIEAPETSSERDENLSEDFQKILSLLDSAKGMNFLNYKSPTVQRRIQRRIALNRLSGPEEYLALLKVQPAELDSLYEDILVKVTSFFRNPESFEALEQHVFPAIMEQLSRSAPVRIWVPGCSTGEEAYSIAMCLLEYMEKINRSAKIELFATDISDVALAKARVGCYDESIAASVSGKRLSRFFVKEGSFYRVGPRIREACVFAKQDVVRDPPFSRLDLISCRNLLIYLTPPSQKRVLAAFHFGLKPNGFLALGNAETIGAATDLFGTTDSLNKIYMKKPGVRGTLVPDFVTDALAKKAEATVPFARQHSERSKKLDVKSQADRAILAQCAPPGVIVNEHMEVLEVRGDTTPFLMLPPGELTANLTKMCRPGLLVELRHGIHDAGKTGEPVRKDGWIKEKDQTSLSIAIDVIPFTEPSTKERYFAVLFGKKAVSEQNPPTPSADNEDELNRVERELAETKDYLNAIIEKEQAINEELKSASEEILSANEELQSTNEEMATAKEETQATNEELSTVNDELQNRNEELGRVNSDLFNLFASVQIPIVMLTENLIIRRFTQSAEKVLNLTYEDIGRSLAEVSSQLQLDQLPKLVSEVMESLNTRDQEIQDRDGKWYSLRIKPYRTLDNKIDGAVIALVDIDSLKRSYDQLQGAYNYADAIVQTAPVPLLVLDANLNIITANQAFCRHFHTNERETKNIRIYDLVNGQWNVPKLRELLEDILPKNEMMENFNIDHEFAGLGRRSMRLSARRLVQQSDSDAKILLAIQDVTAERLAEEEMTAAKESAEAANQSKTDFLANMSHEIRTPLGVILGYSEMLTNPEQTHADNIHSVTRIRKNVEHLTELIDEILDIAKIEAGKLDVERVRFALLPELAETFALLQNRAEGKGLELNIASEGKIPEHITGCPKRMRQILFNIVGNALKFTERGGVDISISMLPATEGKDGVKLCFVVKDTGCGLTVEQQQRLFQPFSQADNSITRRFGGSGLGLMLARRLAQALGGNVLLTKSIVGKGSTFTITLDPGPIAAESMVQGISNVSLERRKEKVADWFIANQHLAGISILLVEDGPDNQALITHFLTESGAGVDVASNGAEAIEKIKDKSYDLLLMDIQMPILDGYQTTKKLRADGYKGPIVALTAHAMQGEREKCLAAGFDEYISKPIKPNLMIDVVSRVAKKKVLKGRKNSHRSLRVEDSIFKPLVERFVRNLPKRMDALHLAQNRSDWREVANQAHQMSGAAGGFGFPEIGKIAAQIETQAKRPEPNKKIIARAINDFDSLCTRVMREVSNSHQH